MNNRELFDLLKAWLAISLAFAIVFSGAQITSYSFLIMLAISLFTVGLGFILHELGHRTLARKYNCRAEFVADNKMLIFAILVSFFGFVFAAPGAVMINGHLTRDSYGKISLMGPLTNIILACLFLPLSFISGIFSLIGFYGFVTNIWLGVFNLIPVWNFDGKKILNWNKGIYTLVLIIGLALFALQFFPFIRTI